MCQAYLAISLELITRSAVPLTFVLCQFYDTVSEGETNNRSQKPYTAFEQKANSYLESS